MTHISSLKISNYLMIFNIQLDECSALVKLSYHYSLKTRRGHFFIDSISKSLIQNSSQSEDLVEGSQNKRIFES